MYELTTGLSAAERFIDGYVLGYFDYFQTVGDEPGGPVIENVAHVAELYMPGNSDYYYVPNGFRFHLALNVWPEQLPNLPTGILDKIAPYVQNEAYQTLMSLLDDKQLELLYDWHRTIVMRGGQQRQQVPLQTLNDLLYVFDDVIIAAYRDEIVVDTVFENEAAFHMDVMNALERNRLHRLDVNTSSAEGNEAVYCVPYSSLIDTWDREYGEIEEFHPRVHHAYKGGGFTCMV